MNHCNLHFDCSEKPVVVSQEISDLRFRAKLFQATLCCLAPARYEGEWAYGHQHGKGCLILGIQNLRRKIIRIHHWFTTQTSTLMMFELDGDSGLNNSPLLTFWSLHELDVFAVALVLNKPCLCTLRAQSSIVKRIAHMHSVHLFGTLLDFLTW